MRNRLIELLKEFDRTPEKTCPHLFDNESCHGCNYHDDVHSLCDINGRKVDFLIANGVIAPPCKVGGTVYEITGNTSNKIRESKVVALIIAIDGKFGVRTDYSFPITREIGRMLFLTKEEAENALNNEKESNKE